MEKFLSWTKDAIYSRYDLDGKWDGKFSFPTIEPEEQFILHYFGISIFSENQIDERLFWTGNINLYLHQNRFLNDIPLECFDPDCAFWHRNYECLINLKREISGQFRLPRCISCINDKHLPLLCFKKEIDEIGGKLIVNKKFQSKSLRVTFLLLGLIGRTKSN